MLRFSKEISLIAICNFLIINSCKIWNLHDIRRFFQLDHCNSILRFFQKNQDENLKDLARFFKEYMPRYGYKNLCSEGDGYGYYQTLGLRLVRKDLFGHNYALALKDLNV